MNPTPSKTVIFLIVFPIVAGFFVGNALTSTPEPDCKPFQTSRVIDGDTIETADGTILRLARIDAPEMNFQSPAQPEHGARKATDFLFFLVSAQTCYEKRSVGHYGRTIAEIKINASDLMLESGNASYYEPDHN